MDKIKRVISEQTVGAVIGFILFGLLVLLFKVHAPVTKLMEAELVSRSPRSVTVQVSGYKIRNCKLISDSFVGWYKNEAGEWTEAVGRVGFPNDETKNSTRPAGIFDRQNFGLFKLNGVPKDASTIRVTVNHLCEGDSIPRVTVNGPWKIK